MANAAAAPQNNGQASNNMQGIESAANNGNNAAASSIQIMPDLEQKKAAPAAPANLFHKLQKAILAVQSEHNESQVKALCSLVDKMTPRLFMKACQERGDAIMEFIGPEIEENGGNVKKAIESVGDFVSDVVWNDILD